MSEEHPWASYEFSYDSISYMRNYSNISIEDIMGIDEANRIYTNLRMGRSYLLLALSVAAIICNSVVLVAFCRMRCKLTSHYIFIVSLTVADMLVGIGHLIELVLFELMGNGCDFLVHSSLAAGTFVCSILNIALITVDHYLSIVYYIQYGKLMSRGRAIICVIAVWVFSVIIGTIQILHGVNTSLNSNDVSFCTAILMDELNISLLVSYGIIYFAAILAIIVMIFAYVRIHIFFGRAQETSDGIYFSDNELRRAKKRTTVTTLWIIGTFALLWIPRIIADMVVISDMPDYESYGESFWLAYEYIVLLPLMNSLCDPVIYSVRLTKIRHALRCCGRRNTEDTEMSAVTQL